MECLSGEPNSWAGIRDAGGDTKEVFFKCGSSKEIKAGEAAGIILYNPYNASVLNLVMAENGSSKSMISISCVAMLLLTFLLN